MITKRAGEKASGILAGFSSRWNPLARRVYVLIKIDNDMIKIPIDHRQLKFIQKEYDVGSRVELEFYDGDWHIMSRTQPSCELHLITGASPSPIPDMESR